MSDSLGGWRDRLPRVREDEPPITSRRAERKLMTDLAKLEKFTVTQKITLMVNRYEIRTMTPDGSPGELLAMAQQKRMAFKEQVTFYSDEKRTMPVFSFKARQRLDLGATYDVLDAAGQPIGWFRKDFGKSFLRSSWHLGTTGSDVQLFGQERNKNVAIARRLWEILPVVSDLPSPFLFHFDFTDPSGRVAFSSERLRSLRDRYVIEVPGAGLDGRLAAAMAVALDALQSR
jgi:uncharacterized protein YxjI